MIRMPGSHRGPAVKAGWMPWLGLLVLGLACGGSNALRADAPAPASRDVRLVLQITVGRPCGGDLLGRYGDRFGEGGFRRLLEQGTVYANAHYQHANTETIVGHTTLATGASPDQHGMIGNVWYDRESRESWRTTSRIRRAPSCRPGRTWEEGAQVDPAQKQFSHEGAFAAGDCWPRPSADELYNAHYAGSVEGVSASRARTAAAVAMAGHAGKAFWYSTDTGDFVTSRLLLRRLSGMGSSLERPSPGPSPHSGRQPGKLFETTPSSYLLGAVDDRPLRDGPRRGYGPGVFPHAFGPASSAPALLHATCW